MTNRYDIIIIGAGSGGLTTASVAGQLGYKVALIEGHKMGGDCLNYGCVPSKAFLHASQKTKDFKKTFQHIKESIKAIEPHDSIERFTSLGIDVIKGYASFLTKDTIKVEESEYTADKIIIATGSRAFIPQIENLNLIDYLTNENVFNLKEKPESIIIYGAGPIGLEMACAFNNLGVKVTVVGRSTGILKHDDPELTEMLKSKLIKDGIEFFENCKIQEVNQKQNKIDFQVECDGDKFILSASHFLIATGRIPNTESLDLDNAGVKYSMRGFIETNSKLQTSNKHVYAIGDVTGKGLFTHLASYQASLIIKRLLFGSFLSKENYTALPWATFTNPEIANIGLTEHNAKKLYRKNIKIISADFKECDRAVTDDVKFGKVKLILDKRGRVLGVSMIGKNAGELIQQWTNIVAKRKKPSALLNHIYIYPTLSEINKLVASKVYKETLFSKKIRLISKLLFKHIGSKI